MEDLERFNRQNLKSNQKATESIEPLPSYRIGKLDNVSGLYEVLDVTGSVIGYGRKIYRRKAIYNELVRATKPYGANIWALDAIDPAIDPEKPEVTVKVSPLSVPEDGNENLVFTFRRSGSTDKKLLIFFDLSGTATAADYASTVVPGENIPIIFLEGKRTIELTFDPIADEIEEEDETVIITIVEDDLESYFVGELETPDATERINFEATGAIIEKGEEEPPPEEGEEEPPAGEEEEPPEEGSNSNNGRPPKTPTPPNCSPPPKGCKWQDAAIPCNGKIQDYDYAQLNTGRLILCCDPSVTAPANGGCTPLKYACKDGNIYPKSKGQFNTRQQGENSLIPPPFNGGQCPKGYQIYFEATVTSGVSVGVTVERIARDGGGQTTFGGPIQSISSPEIIASVWKGTFAANGISGEYTTDFTAIGSTTFSKPSLTRVVALDGIDDCGDLPPTCPV